MRRFRGWVAGFVLGAAVATGVWVWRSGTSPGDDRRFLEERLGLVQAENDRLRKLVGDATAAREAEADVPRRAEIERITAGVRELKFLTPVAYELLNRDRVPEVVREKMAQHYGPEDFRRMSAAYAALGLLPENYDLEKGIVGLLGEQLAAFYDQHADRLFLLEGTRLESSNDRMILSHELTHALQDQNFQLERFPLEEKEDDDLVMALGALIEGDATSVMTRFLLEDHAAPRMGDLASALFAQDLTQLAGAPRYLRESLLFPYVKGQKFCDTLIAHGGMAAVTAAFRDPPRTTAEILDPSRYLAPALRPRRPYAAKIELPDGLTRVATNTAGRFGIECLFEEWLAGEKAQAPDWDADRFWVLRDGEGAVSLLWRSRWRTTEAAVQFEDRLRRVREAVAAKRGGAAREVRRSIERRGEEVFLVEGPEGMLPRLRAVLDGAHAVPAPRTLVPEDRP